MGFLFDFKFVNGWIMFWYLLVVMVIRLINMVDVEMWEKNDIILYWKFWIFDVGMVKEIKMGKISKWWISLIIDKWVINRLELFCL